MSWDAFLAFHDKTRHSCGNSYIYGDIQAHTIGGGARAGGQALGECRRRGAVNNDDTDFAISVWFNGAKAVRAQPAFADYVRGQGYIPLWDGAGSPDLCTRRAPGDYACK